MLTPSALWKTSYPGAAAGALVLHNVTNPNKHPGLEQIKTELERDLRARYSGLDRAALAKMAILQAYNAYFKRFKKSYHVQLQLESIVFKDKSIPSVAALVEAMFMAELKNLLLTAGHDLDKIQPPVRLDVASGNERYTLLRGQDQELKKDDMFIADQAGVISSVLYGPDQRTQIHSETRNVLFTVYAAPGLAEQNVRQHLTDIYNYILVFCPQTELVVLETYQA
jgi:DNA/RNA-binding domain of Phe-tRNA-synthetase-like protein